MSPQCLASLSEFRRSQSTVTSRGVRYESWWRSLLSLFLDVQRWDREDDDLEDWDDELPPLTDDF